MISRSTIDAVFETARVEEVIGEFVQLKKSGSNFKGLSPFNDERTPSFMVSPVKQIWKDFSSGKGGSVVSFLMEHEHFTYPEAIKYLAKKYGIPIEETEQTDEQKQEADERESMYLVTKFAAEWFQKQLGTSTGRAVGLSYFKERGFTEATIDKFMLGYSPDEWSAFTDVALKKGYGLEFLESTGLTIVKGEKKFDRFKGRVMFPIRNLSGRVLGFGGRILDNQKKAAKYLNSPQSLIYDKSEVLYGIHEGKKAIAKADMAYIVEGYTDVIQFHQTGVENVVSSSGTALTPKQIKLIARFTNNVTLLYDGDAAGERAAIRGVDLILEEGMNVRVCTFPEGHDPDSFARENTATELTSYLEENSTDFIRYKSGLLKEEAAGDPIKKAGMIRDIVQSLSKIPDPISREVFIRESATILDIAEETLYSAIAQMRASEERHAKKQGSRSREKPSMEVAKSTSSAPKVDRRSVLEHTLISILLNYGHHTVTFKEEFLQEDEGELSTVEVEEDMNVYEKIYLDLQDDEVEFSDERFKKLFARLVEEFQKDQDFEVGQLLPQLDKEEADLVAQILLEEDKYQLHDWDSKMIFVKSKEEKIAAYVMDTILNLRRLLIEAKITDLKNELLADNENDEIPAAEMELIQDYVRLKRYLGTRLNRVV